MTKSLLLLLITSFGIFKLLAIVSSVLLFTTSDYLFGIFKLWWLYCLSFYLLLLINSFGIFKLLAIVSSVLLFTTSGYLLWYLQTFGHCIVCPSIYYFWLPPWLSSNFWPLYRLSFYLLLLKKDRWYNGQKFEDTKGGNQK
jgi:hypothetical protein